MAMGYNTLTPEPQIDLSQAGRERDRESSDGLLDGEAELC